MPNHSSLRSGFNKYTKTFVFDKYQIVSLYNSQFYPSVRDATAAATALATALVSSSLLGSFAARSSLMDFAVRLKISCVVRTVDSKSNLVPELVPGGAEGHEGLHDCFGYGGRDLVLWGWGAWSGCRHATRGVLRLSRALKKHQNRCAGPFYHYIRFNRYRRAFFMSKSGFNYGSSGWGSKGRHNRRLLCRRCLNRALKERYGGADGIKQA
jgi:hypothetical protein